MQTATERTAGKSNAEKGRTGQRKPFVRPEIQSIEESQILDVQLAVTMCLEDDCCQCGP